MADRLDRGAAIQAGEEALSEATKVEAVFVGGVDTEAVEAVVGKASGLPRSAAVGGFVEALTGNGVEGVLVGGGDLEVGGGGKVGNGGPTTALVGALVEVAVDCQEEGAAGVDAKKTGAVADIRWGYVDPGGPPVGGFSHFAVDGGGKKGVDLAGVLDEFPAVVTHV